jgi:hypothetical protein
MSLFGKKQHENEYEKAQRQMNQEPVEASKERIYFDEITGEIKMLVTIDRDPLTGRMAVRTIEYVE